MNKEDVVGVNTCGNLIQLSFYDGSVKTLSLEGAAKLLEKLSAKVRMVETRRGW